jgi:hypothetical protein
MLRTLKIWLEEKQLRTRPLLLVVVEEYFLSTNLFYIPKKLKKTECSVFTHSPGMHSMEESMEFGVLPAFVRFGLVKQSLQ